jgi:hypothetical protein
MFFLLALAEVPAPVVRDIEELLPFAWPVAVAAGAGYLIYYLVVHRNGSSESGGPSSAPQSSTRVLTPNGPVPKRQGSDVGGPEVGLLNEPHIRRTPHLDAPELLPPVGTTFPVRVWVDAAPAGISEQSDDVVLVAPPEVESIELDVLLVTSPHLAIAGPYAQLLTIERNVPTSVPVDFQVTVVNSHEPGPVTLVAQFLYGGWRPCGRVRREWKWPSGRPLLATASTGGVPIHVNVREPDLTVLIVSTGEGRYTCTVSVPSSQAGTTHLQRPSVWDLEGQSPSELIARYLTDVIDRSGPESAGREALNIAGRRFWNAAPQAFKDQLWRLIDARSAQRISGRATIYIASDEPLLPWEIMRPSRPRRGAQDEERPDVLGVEFAIGRWIRGDGLSPPPTLPIRNSFLIAARYKKLDDLDPTIELQALSRHFAGEQLEHASFAYLDEHLQSHAASLLHFVCHGAALEHDTQIFLDDGECTSSRLRNSAGFRAACAARLPVVFLNACSSGLGKATLGPGGAGFPRAFAELGARAVIAPLWPVSMTSAPIIASALYESAAAAPDRSLADILSELRAKSYRSAVFDDSWAAYCLFGDPNAVLRPA